MARLLVVDDQPNMRATLAITLGEAGYDVDVAEDGDRACERIAKESYDVVLTDLRMGGTDGMDVLRFVKEHTPLTEVIVMTAYGSVQSAVEAMREGAHDYIEKPFEPEVLLLKVAKALEKRQLMGEVEAMASDFRARYDMANIIGRSAPMREVFGRIVRVAPTDTTVLVTGESGTGKELVARAIHANSRRSDRPFVTVNCAAISETLLESELFGHVRGAFTGAVASRKGLFEEADGGTFFFDEIAETPPSFQAKLLRAIQEGEIRRVGDNRPIHVDVRVVAATNRDLKKEIAEGRFREDLYYRLNVVRFRLPPLRERREDIPLLVEHFLAKFGHKMGRRVRLGEGVLSWLLRYDFPGNVRELENLIEQGVALAVDGEVRLEDVLPEEAASTRRPGEGATTLQAIVERAEQEAIERVLREVDGNRERAAELLGVSSTTLWRKMRRLNVVYP